MILVNSVSDKFVDKCNQLTEDVKSFKNKLDHFMHKRGFINKFAKPVFVLSNPVKFC